MPISQIVTNSIANGAVGATQTASANQFYGFKNRIINGAMMIDQRNAGASITPADNGYVTDRWRFSLSQTSKLTSQQSTVAPTGFGNSLLATSSSAYTVGSSESFLVSQKIEGFNFADMAWGTANAQTVTISFWVRSSLTGAFGGSVTNSAVNRCYPFSYTISSANTWEQKTVTISGDTTGTWVGATNGTGAIIYFSLGAGSTVSGTASSWQAGTFLSVTGATSVVGTNGATFYITGVQLEKGSTATSFDYRPYTTELQLCQRYYEAGGTYTTGTTASSALGRSNVCFKVVKRATPTVAFTVVAGNTSGFVTEYTSVDGLSMGARGSFVGDYTCFNFTAASEL